MSVIARQNLEKVLETLPESQLNEVLNFAQFLRWSNKIEEEERQAWLNFGPESPEMDAANEPEYTLANLRPELDS